MLDNNQGQELLLKYVDGLMHYICVWHANSFYLSKFRVITVTNFEIIRKIAFSHGRVMVICIGTSRYYTLDTFACTGV